MGGETRGKIKVMMFELIAYAIGSDGRRRRLDSISQSTKTPNDVHSNRSWKERCERRDDCGVFIGYPGMSSTREKFQTNNDHQGLGSQGGLNRKNYTPWNWIAIISDRRTMDPI